MSFAESFGFGPIIPSVPVSLPFDPQLLAASPDTLRTAHLWPNDAILQELLKTVIQIAADDAAEDDSSFVLTTPAAVSLAGCAMRIAMYLVSQAIESGTDILVTTRPVNLVPLFGDLHRTALQRFEHGGWSSAASPMPRSIIEFCWEQAKEQILLQQTDEESSDVEDSEEEKSEGENLEEENSEEDPDKEYHKHYHRMAKLRKQRVKPQVYHALTSEAQQAVLAAIVVEWIRQLLKSMRSAATRYKSPLLTAACLYQFMPSSGSPADIFNTLGCSVIINLECSPFTLLFNNSTEDNISSPFFMSSESRGLERMVDAENDAARLLLHKSSWFHHPHASRRVAQQVISGERKLHASDIVLNKMGMRLLGLNFHFLPQAVFAGQNDRSHEDRLMLRVTDAAGCAWPLDLLTNPGDQKRGSLRPSSKNHVIATFFATFSGTVNVQLPVGSTSEFSKMFAPHLSDKQQTVLKQLQQSKSLFDEAEDLNKSVLKDACNYDLAHQLGQPSEGSSVVVVDNGIPQSKSEPWDPTKDVISRWRIVASEQITAVAIQFLDYSRWGFQRYEGEKETTEVARRQFQSYLIDAAMQASQMPLLPTVILDLIAAYDTMEVLPYITNEEQTALLQESVSLSDEELCSILESM